MTRNKYRVDSVSEHRVVRSGGPKNVVQLQPHQGSDMFQHPEYRWFYHLLSGHLGDDM